MVMSVYGGMGDTGLRDRLPALWRRIEDAHYSYLETDDSPEKLQQKKKLEGYIIEYLSLVPQECKFGVPETAKVFQRSINELPEFSAYRAGLGWAALGRYAANLLTQPWRKEYKVIRLYSGYYKHEVEANLVGAETLLLAMGYKPVGAGKLALDAPVCPDMVAAISRDALIAQCECQIMAEIWENAWSSGARVTWAEVLQARAGRGLTVPITATTIAYGDGSEIYSNVSDTISPGHHSHTRIEARHHNNILPQNNRLCSNGLHLEEPVNHIHTSYVMSPNMLPPQLVYEIPPHMHSEVPLAVPQCNPIPMIPTYGAVPYYYSVQTPYIVPTPVYAPVKHAATIPVNGYSPIPQYRYPTVPTGQLIELDTSLCENRKHERHSREDERNLRKSKHDENLRRNSTSKSGLSDVSLPSVPRSDTQPVLSKAREDGMGTYESWDYVFRNLSSKDQDGDRSRFSPSLDRDSRTLDRLNKEERRTKYQPTTLDLEDGMQALNLDRSQDEDAYRTAKVNENLMRLKQEQEAKRVKQLAKKQADEKRITKVVDPVLNPSSDGLINHKVAPDKVRLLSKKEVKDRKDIIKQQNGAVHNTVEMKKVKKPLKLAAVDLEKPSRSKPLENGVHIGHTLKSSVATNTVKPIQEINPQLIVTLDETDSIRRTTKTQPSDRERSISRTSHVSDRQRNNDCDSVMNKDKWECATCTFLNKVSLQACEMCGKSKKGPEIQPLTSGGRECPACTLVNKRDAILCDACGTSLEHCPTYI